MKKILLFSMGMGLMVAADCYAQENTYLKKLTDDVAHLRKTKSSIDALNKTVIDWSASGSPKITLMDDIKRDSNNAKKEYRGNGTNPFKINQVVTHVYGRQNVGMVSKGDYFNSTEKDIYYSVIEKTIKKKCTVSYTLTGHIGTQEFVFVSFNANAKYSSMINDKPAQPVAGKSGIFYLKLPRVEKEDTITLSITNNSDSNQSIVILNYNPQKQ